MKTRLRHLLQDVWYGAQMPFTFFSAAAGKQVVLYHDVADADYSAYNHRHLPLAQFEAHIRFFKKHFDVVPLRQLLHTDFTPSRPALAITFDDGFANNFHVALPVLKKHNAAATFFVTTSSLITPGFVHAACAADLMKVHSPDTSLQIGSKIFHRKPKGLFSEAGESVYAHIVSMNMQARNEWMQSIAEPLAGWKQQAPELLWRCMNRDELLQLLQVPGMEVQSHTHTHMNLNKLNETELLYEVETSVSVLQNLLQKPVDMLAHPFVYAQPAVQQKIAAVGIRYQFGGWLTSQQTEYCTPRTTVVSGASQWRNLHWVKSGFARAGF